MGLSGQQLEKLRDALLDAFRTQASLEEMLLFKLDKRLREITTHASLKYIVFELLQVAEAEGWLKELVSAARKSNPGNLSLQKIEVQVIPPGFKVLDDPFFQTEKRKRVRSKIIHQAKWPLILQDNYIERDQQGQLLAHAQKLAKFPGISLLLIRGEPGAGKSALMLWLAYELFRQEHRVFQKEAEFNFGWLEQLREFSENTGEQHFYVIADDLFRDNAILDELKNFGFTFPCTLIGTTRLNEDQGGSLQEYGYKIKSLDLNRPSDEEKQRVLSKICLDETIKEKIQRMTAAQRQELMNSPIMLVLMLQLHEGKVFQNIIADIIKNLRNTKKYPIYEIFGIFCSFFQYGITVPQEILRLCLPEFEYSQKFIKRELEGLIDTAAYAGFEGFTTIHELIAKTAMEIDYKPEDARHNQPYSWFDTPPLLEKYLIKVIENVEPSDLIQEHWIRHGLRLLAVRGEVNIVRKILQNYPQQIQALQDKSSIHSLFTWAKVYEILKLPDQQKRCTDAISLVEPQNIREWFYWISFIHRFGTLKQKQSAIAQTTVWLESYPDDYHVRTKYLGLIENYGTLKQKQNAIVQTTVWLESHLDDIEVRTKYLGLIENHGTLEQKQNAIAQITVWLESHLDDTKVRTKYLGLIENYGTQEQKQNAIAQTTVWLESHPDDYHVRTKYLGLIENHGTLEQKQNAIVQTTVWLESHLDDIEVRTKYLGLIENYSTQEQKQNAIAQITVWLESHLDDTKVRTKYLGLIENYGTQEQKQNAIAQTTVWLESHPDKTDVRTRYLVLFGKVSGKTEEIQAAIKQQWQWFRQQQRVSQDLWGAFLAIVFHHAQPELIQEAINCALQQYPENTAINATVFGYFRDYLDYETCYQLADKIRQSPLPIDKWQNHIHAANFFRDYGELDIAEKMYNRIINSANMHVKIHAKNSQKAIDFASLNYARLLLLKETPDYDTVIGRLNRILKRNPKHAVAHWFMALCYREKDQIKTIDSFKKAIKFDQF